MSNKLDIQDLSWAIRRLPKNLKDLMEQPEWLGRIYVGGGYLRSIVSNEQVNDVDVFVESKEVAELLAYKLAKEKSDVYTTENAFTIKGQMTVQIIHRWVFNRPEEVSNSFDFTVCCAVIFCKNYTDFSTEDKKTEATWDSYRDDRFYTDLAAKRLVYRSPVRNEDAGGSMLRVLKYYQRGYRIPLDSLGAVMARLVKEIDQNKVDLKDEKAVAKLLTALLVEVDPAIDPGHLAHLPSQGEL